MNRTLSTQSAQLLERTVRTNEEKKHACQRVPLIAKDNPCVLLDCVLRTRGIVSTSYEIKSLGGNAIVGFVKARRWIADQRSLLESNCRSLFLPFLPILASMSSAYTMTPNPPSKANYALLSPYVYVTDRRVATAGHDSGFWSSLSLCSTERGFAGRGRSKEGYRGVACQGLYRFGVRWAWKGHGHEHGHEAGDGSIRSQYCLRHPEDYNGVGWTAE